MQQLWQQYGKYALIIGAVSVVLLFYFTRTEAQQPELLPLTPTLEEPKIEQQPIEPEPPQVTTVLVDVKGAVKQPGVYPLTTEERIIDALTIAGGITDEADTKLINYAQKLQDEMVIYIPKQGEEPSPEAVATQAQPTSTTSQTTTTTVNLNTADETQLMTIPGIGPAKAASIISYRTEQGNFTTIEDVKKISGIGDKTFEKLKDYISVK